MPTTRKQKPLAVSLLASMEGWETLAPSDQSTIETEFFSLYESLRSLSLARLAVGEHLHNIRSILEPMRLFTKFLYSQTSLSRATAYRYIDLYVATSSRLPPPVMEVVMERGVDTINLKRLEASPPPKTTSIVRINEWVDSIQARAPKEERLESPEDLKKDCYNYTHSRFTRLPSSHKIRSQWMRSLIGMMLADLGVSGLQSISPESPPEGFIAVRGRPRKIAA